MKFKLFLALILIYSCANTNTNNSLKKISHNSQGFAYIYTNDEFINKNVSKKFDNTTMQISSNYVKRGVLLKIINPHNKKNIILKNSKNADYPEFYNILITEPVAFELGLNKNIPYVEVIEIKKNKSFKAKKAKTYIEEKTVDKKAPVQKVAISNISKNKFKTKNLNKKKSFFINIGTFYSLNTAKALKSKIIEDLELSDSNIIKIKSKKKNQNELTSGPYTSINLMKNDYIQLKKFGFEQLDIKLND